MEAGDRRSEYFQEVARLFLQRRGAPFILSSRDIEMIKTWEDRGIPLRIVLEGISHFFDDLSASQKRKTALVPLTRCAGSVRSAFELYKSRRVGDRPRAENREDKRFRMKKEIQKFLGSLPPELFLIKPFFEEALNILEQNELDEDRLDILDLRAEKLLADAAEKAEQEKTRCEVSDEHRGRDAEEIERIIRLKLIKLVRERYRVPHLSTFYY